MYNDQVNDLPSYCLHVLYPSGDLPLLSPSSCICRQISPTRIMHTRECSFCGFRPPPPQQIILCILGPCILNPNCISHVHAKDLFFILRFIFSILSIFIPYLLVTSLPSPFYTHPPNTSHQLPTPSQPDNHMLNYLLYFSCLPLSFLSFSFNKYNLFIYASYIHKYYSQCFN